MKGGPGAGGWSLSGRPGGVLAVQAACFERIGYG